MLIFLKGFIDFYLFLKYLNTKNKRKSKEKRNKVSSAFIA